MNQQEIEQLMQKEMSEFLDETFPAPLPVWFKDYFEKAIMETPQHVEPYRTELIQSILNKRIDELSIQEVGFIALLYQKCTPTVFAKDIHKFLVKKTAFEALAVTYVQMRAGKERSIHRKAQSFDQNKIVTATTMPQNGLKIK